MNHDETFGDDVPIEEDDLLIQRYLDGTLDEEECLQVEFRIDEDPAFASRIQAYETMFAALDRSALARAAVLWSTDMPALIVDAAVNRWNPGAEEADHERVPSGLEQVFGGWRPAAVAFALADLVLVGLLGLLAVTHGPLEIVRSWVIGLKDVVLFVAANGPSAEQLTVIVPIAAVASVVGLYGVWSGMRTVWTRARVQS
jgi:anti-sigma-K factor RskA